MDIKTNSDSRAWWFVGCTQVRLDNVAASKVSRKIYRTITAHVGFFIFIIMILPSRCTIVLFNTKKNKQQHIVNGSRKTITCLTFSPDGKFLATGECGHAPSLRVWNLADFTQVAEFQEHKYGINCVVSYKKHKKNEKFKCGLFHHFSVWLSTCITDVVFKRFSLKSSVL